MRPGSDAALDVAALDVAAPDDLGRDAGAATDSMSDADADLPDAASIAQIRPLAPLSVFVTTERPVLRWVLAPGTDGAWVQLCRQRSCMMEQDLQQGVSGAEWQTPTLEEGAWFWRVYGMSRGVRGTRPSVTWEFIVRARRSASPDGGVDAGASVASAIPDFNGDGLADIAVRSRGSGGDAGVGGYVYVYPGLTGARTPTRTTTLTLPSDTVVAGGAASIGDFQASRG